jgi:hypothetical protein
MLTADCIEANGALTGAVSFGVVTRGYAATASGYPCIQNVGAVYSVWSDSSVSI